MVAEVDLARPAEAAAEGDGGAPKGASKILGKLGKLGKLAKKGAKYLPTGGAARLMWAAVGDFPYDPGSIVTLVAWTIALGTLAVWAYRRDEGRRFS